MNDNKPTLNEVINECFADTEFEDICTSGKCLEFAMALFSYIVQVHSGEVRPSLMRIDRTFYHKGTECITYGSHYVIAFKGDYYDIYGMDAYVKWQDRWDDNSTFTIERQKNTPPSMDQRFSSILLEMLLETNKTLKEISK